ncbi:MAG: glycosyltransferase family A protein [Rikenellaceae bacterium]
MNCELNKLPLISVITPVYNMEEFLGETLDSILSSDYPNFEVVVVDDGSSDNSYQIAKQYAAKDGRVRAFTQKNGGVCVARNFAIENARGEFILPVDSDDLISSDYLTMAMDIILADSEVRVVAPNGEFFGGRQGEFKLPAFSLNLLARRNIIPPSGVYRKADWQRVGGYCVEIIATEDWEFWISILKDGGKVVKVPRRSYFYRVRKQSKRIRDRKLKKHVVNVLNQRHPEFFERELGGKLHYQRSWSKFFNRLSKIFR